MLRRYFLLLLFPLSITSCSSSTSVNSSVSQPVKTSPISATPVAAIETKPALDVWSTEMEICYPPLLKPCYSMKANTLGKPTEMGFLYSHDQEANGVPLSPIQSSQSPMPKMPEIVPQKGLFSKSVDFRMRVFFKSNGVFTGLETPSTTPVFFPLKVAHGYYGTPENFYKYIDGMSYTVKSMVQLDSQQQASVILHTPIEKRSPVNDPHHHEFQPEDLREVISKGIEFKPQQVEPIVIGQKVGLKKW